MKQTILAAILATALASPALASSCPRHMAEIDAALAKNPSVSAADMAEARKLRAEGEAQHKAGKHKESEEALAKAKKLLGMM